MFTDFAQPHCDNGVLSIVLGSVHRVCRKTPRIDRGLMKEFRSFVRLFCRKNFRDLQLTLDDDVSIRTWLEGSSYTASQKTVILRDFERFLDRHRVDDAGHISVHTSFTKQENPDIGLSDSTFIDNAEEAFKNSRNIQGASNVSKVIFNPVFNVIADKIFHWVNPALGYCPFAKSCPVNEIPKYITENLMMVGQRNNATDHTAFEAHTSIQAMMACELQVYWYMIKRMPWAWRWMTLLLHTMTDEIQCRFRSVKLTIHDSRMSGDGCTSLGNGLTNYLLLEFAAYRSRTSCRMLIEGDDGIFTASSSFPGRDFFSLLGFNVKMTNSVQLNEVGFLSMVWHPETLHPMRDIRSVISRFGLSFSQARHGGDRVCAGLLRAKAFSLLALYPHEPVLNVLASRVLDLTRSVKARFDQVLSWKAKYVANLYRLHFTDVMKFAYITMDQRDIDFCARMFGVTPVHQDGLVRAIMRTPLFGKIDYPFMSDFLPRRWKTNFEDNSLTLYKGMPWSISPFYRWQNVRRTVQAYSSQSEWLDADGDPFPPRMNLVDLD